MHFYAWKKGLKTGMYYLRTKAAADAIKFTVEKYAEDVLQPLVPTESADEEDMRYRQRAADEVACSLNDPDSCISCSG